MGIIMAVGNGFRTLRVVGVGVLAALASVGCGSSSAPQLGDTAANRLQRSLDDVRQHARRHDRARALEGLSRFSRSVAGESRVGHLSPADARALRIGIAQARRRIELEIRPAPAATPAPLPTQQGPQGSGPAEPPESQKNQGEGEDEDKDKDKGRDKDKDKGKGEDER